MGKVKFIQLVLFTFRGQHTVSVTKVIHEATVATDKNMTELLDCMKQIESGSCLSLFLLKIFFFLRSDLKN